MIAWSIDELIGRTPILRLYNSSKKYKCGIYGKLECLNPGGSIKDRTAWYMTKDAIHNNKLKKGMTIVEVSSGNTGIGFAMVAASFGFKCLIIVPHNISAEKIQLLKAFGARVYEMPSNTSTKDAIDLAEKIVDAFPESYWFPNQYTNDLNWMAHYRGTAPEIFANLPGVTHIVCAVGTSGTAMGIGRYIYNQKLQTKLVGVSVAKDSKIHGLKSMSRVKKECRIYSDCYIHEFIKISDNEAIRHMRQLAKEEGILVGMSSGAAYAAAIKIAKKNKKAVIVAIFPDRGERYLSLDIW